MGHRSTWGRKKTLSSAIQLIKLQALSILPCLKSTANKLCL